MLRGVRSIAALVVLIAFLAPATATAAGRCGDHPWCDTTKSADERTQLLLAQLTLPEKADLLWGDEQFGVANASDQFHTGRNYGNVRLGIPDLFFSDGPVGPRQGAASTAMPAPIGLAASFDPALAKVAGGLVADEVKAKGNDVVFAPTVNIMRTPRGGRTFEGYGEDPYLAGRQAVGWIRGAQDHGVIADVKHFAANNQEKDRMTIDERIDERTLREIYLPQFEAAIKRGHSGTIMCAYNQVNSQFACENRHLLTDILEKEWGFKGFVLADYPAGHDTAASLKNGLDFEPFGAAYTPARTLAAIASGQASVADLDEHVRRILRTMFAFGVFDRDAYPNDPASIPVDAHADVAARVEEGGITLLKNTRKLLPLTGAKTIAVIGSDANRAKSGGGSSYINPLKLTTTLAGIKTRAGDGVQVVFDDSDDPAHSAATAKAADVAIVVAADTAAEGDDQSCIAIDCSDDKIITGLLTSETKKRNTDAVVAAVGKAQPKTVVVLETSGPVLTDWRDQVAAIVEAWYPGESGGTAIARVLFGDIDPGGRLPATFPARQQDLPTEQGDPEQYPGVDGVVTYKEGVLVGYRWFDAKRIKPVFPFGFGKSYTRFTYRKLRVRGRRVSFTVRNVGRRTGFAVPQLYTGIPVPAGTTEPPRQLKGFTKLSLAPGRRKRVTLKLNRRSFSYYDVGKAAWTVAPGCARVFVGRSSRDLPLKGRRAVGGGTCKR